jgi:hypothetical protein
MRRLRRADFSVSPNFYLFYQRAFIGAGLYGTGPGAQ